ncbi:MAG: hypothetical protein ABI977_37760 [Acidobacteriota bacterium]
MTISIKIKSLLGRIALAVAALLFSVGSTGIIISHFVVRTMADHRIVIGRETLASASVRLPGSPRVQFRLAEAKMTEPSGTQIPEAQLSAARAVNLSPWNYRYWQVLAVAEESLGKSEEAERALRAAAKLAPNYVEVNWELANLMLRQGKLNESLGPFRVATKANNELLPSAYDLLWQASGGNLSLLTTLADSDAKMQLGLTQFLVEQSQADAATVIYRGIDARAKISSPSAAAFISSMLKVNPQAARALWLDTMKAVSPQPAADGLIWNGGFEVDSLKQFNHFDWTISASDYARIGFDRSGGRGGGRSLKVSFAGRDTTRLEGEIKQLVVLRPGARYRLECYAKAQNLVTPEGPRLGMLTANGLVAVSDPVEAGSSDWQNLVVTFIAPAEAAAYVTIVRKPRFSYDEPTRGIIWFDDFKLTEA